MNVLTRDLYRARQLKPSVVKSCTHIVHVHIQDVVDSM